MATSRELAAQFLAFAEKKGDKVPLMIGHRFMGCCPWCIRETSRMAAYTTIRRLRFSTLSSIVRWRRDLARMLGGGLIFRSWARWLLGYPEAALADANKRSVRRVRLAKPLL